MSGSNNRKDESLFLEKHKKKLNIGMSIVLIFSGLNYLPVTLSKLSFYDQQNNCHNIH
jgi:hypothetical protein